MFFLVFEGLDGSGKSSLMKRLNQHLVENQQGVIVTREPGGTDLGDQIRNLILQKTTNSLLTPVPKAELLLYQASRAQHVECVIKPALEKKKWVLCDRFTASSVAFQGAGRSIDVEKVYWLNQFSTSSLAPDLTILLDLTVEESEKRRQNRVSKTGEPEDRIESEKSDFHTKVRKGFLDQARLEPKRWLVLDAAKTQEELFVILRDHLRNLKWL